MEWDIGTVHTYSTELALFAKLQHFFQRVLNRSFLDEWIGAGNQNKSLGLDSTLLM
jgi:hypothetical protein